MPEMYYDMWYMEGNFLPSKKIFFVVVPVIVLVLLVVVLGGERDQDDDLDFSTFTYSLEPTDPDADGDGLADWEEDAWKTDKNDPDTDGDGVSDGEEVQTNRHPGVAGPDDEITSEQKQAVYLTAARRGIEVPESKSNRTQEVLDYLLPQALVAANDSLNGRTAKAEEIQSAVEPIAAQIAANRYVPAYGVSDIAIASEVVDPALYANEVLSVILDASKQIEADKSDLELLADVMEGDSTALDNLTRHKDVYGDIVRGLLSVSVSEDLAVLHLSVVNNYHVLALAVEDMTKIKEDPLGAVLAIEAYRSAEISSGELFYSLGLSINAS